jgi:Ca2+-binding RTX toxin-like protein
LTLSRLLVVAVAAVLCLATTASGSTQRVCTITGTAGPDILFGTAGPDVICGLGGDDKLAGMAGNDVLIGGPGADYLEGGPGHDTYLGGPGDDEIRSYDFSRDVVDGGPGIDSAWTDHFDVVRNVEHLG